MISHIDEHQIHFYITAIKRRGTYGETVLKAIFPIPGIGSERVNQSEEVHIIKLTEIFILYKYRKELSIPKNM